MKYVQQLGIEFVQYALAVPQFDNRRTKLVQIRRSEMPLLPRTRETIDLDGHFDDLRCQMNLFYDCHFLWFCIIDFVLYLVNKNGIKNVVPLNFTSTLPLDRDYATQ